MRNKNINWDNPMYLFLKKHKCPSCNNKITPKKVRKVINSKSVEAKEYDFSCGDSYLIGDVEFTFYIFNCEKCTKEFKIEEIRKYEKRQTST
jgi:hypothetical protein